MNLFTIQQGQSYRGHVPSYLTNYLLEDGFLATASMQHVDLDLPDTVSSTIAIATSLNGQFYASTHGDHTVKVFQFATNTCMRVFAGHPRTPWTVKFNQADQDILASGCLGCQVRVWSIRQNSCLGVIRLQFPIISLSFHASGDYIAAASGSTLEIWKWKVTCDYYNDGVGYEDKRSKVPNIVTSSNIANDRPFAAPSNNGKTGQYMLRPITHGRNIRAVLFHPCGDYLLIAAPETPRLPTDVLTYCSVYAVKLSTLFHSSGAHDPPLIPIELSSYPSILPQIHLYSDGGIDISRDGKYLITCARLHCPPHWGDSMPALSTSTSVFSPMSTTDGMEDQVTNNSNNNAHNIFRQLSTHPMSVPRLQYNHHNLANTTNSNLCSTNSSQETVFSTPPPPPPMSWPTAAAAMDFLLPRPQPQHMEWRPFAASQLPHFSSAFPNIGTDNTTHGTPIQKKHGLSHTYLDSLDSSALMNKKLSMAMDVEETLSCNNNNNNNNNSSTNKALLHPSTVWINPQWSTQLQSIQAQYYPHSAVNEPAYKKCHAVMSNPTNPANTVFANWTYEEHLCVFQFQFDNEGNISCPTLHNARLLPGTLIHAITSVRISPTGRYALLGFGVRSKDNIVVGHDDPKAVCEIIALHEPELDTISVIHDEDDEVNIAQFHPNPGLGLLYGTKRGKVRVFTRTAGCEYDDDMLDCSWV